MINGTFLSIVDMGVLYYCFAVEVPLFPPVAQLDARMIYRDLVHLVRIQSWR